MKKISATWWMAGFAAFIVLLFVWSLTLQSNDTNVVARQGLHWHSTLTINVKGQQMEIPANIGIGAVHQPMHTHTEDASKGVIHMEFGGLVKKDDLKLGNFFRNWNKDMRSFGTGMKMMVNGMENMDYENYMMRDGDTIELRYE